MKPYKIWGFGFGVTFTYNNDLSELENFNKFKEVHDLKSYKNFAETCHLKDDVIQREYDNEIKKLIDLDIIKPPISDLDIMYIDWKVNKIPDSCLNWAWYLPLFKHYSDKSNNKKYYEEFIKNRFREDISELCHLYDDYKQKEDKLEDNAKRFDLATLEKNFGDGADTSPIRYALAVKNLTEYLSLKFDEYVSEKADVLAELQKLPAALNEFIPNVQKVRADLNNFHADALKIYSSFIDAENLHGLYNLYKESYPPFSIVAETLTEKIRQVILRVEIFEIMPDFVRGICAEVTKKFNGNDKVKTYFDAVTEIYSNLFSYVLEGHLRQEIVKKAAAERVLEILTTYRKSLDNIKIDPCVKGSCLAEMRESKELNNIQIQGEIARCGKICKNSLKEIEESLTDETEKRWLRINCIEKISG